MYGAASEGAGSPSSAAATTLAERQHHDPGIVPRRDDDREADIRTSGSSARTSSVSGERPNRPSAPTGAGMI